MPKITALQTAENLSGMVSNYVTGVKSYLEQQLTMIEELQLQATKDLASAQARITLAEKSRHQFQELMEQFSTINSQAQQAAQQIQILNQEEQNKLQHKAEMQAINRKIAAIKKKQKAEAEKKAQETAQIEIDKQIQNLLQQQRSSRRASVMASVRAKYIPSTE